MTSRTDSEVECGAADISGVKVEVPADRYDGLIVRLAAYLNERRESRDSVNTFLAYRCGKEFLQRFIEMNPGFLADLHVMSYFDSITSIKVVNKAHRFGLLPEGLRLDLVKAVGELAVATPDAGYLDHGVVAFLTPLEEFTISQRVKSELLIRIEDEVDNWQSNCSSDESPSEFFWPLSSALTRFAREFEDDAWALAQVKRGQTAILRPRECPATIKVR